MFFYRQAGKLVNCCLMVEVFLCLSCAAARSGDLTADQISGPDPYVAAVSRFLQKMSPKIINGNPAATGTYKWQTSLQVSWISDPVQAHFCGGSLIAPGWVLTAGHCVSSLKATDFTVVAGTIDLTKIGQRQTVTRTLVHKDYFLDSSNIVAGTHPVNDVALVKLFTPFNMTGDANNLFGRCDSRGADRDEGKSPVGDGIWRNGGRRRASNQKPHGSRRSLYRQKYLQYQRELRQRGNRWNALRRRTFR
jgi:secreted trypsin-like serine protease